MMKRHIEDDSEESPPTEQPASSRRATQSTQMIVSFNRHVRAGANGTKYIAVSGRDIYNALMPDPSIFLEYETYRVSRLTAKFIDAEDASDAFWFMCKQETFSCAGIRSLGSDLDICARIARESGSVQSFHAVDGMQGSVDLFCEEPVAITINGSGVHCVSDNKMVSTGDPDVRWWGFGISSSVDRIFCVALALELDLVKEV